jgi:hypothetical protein
LRDGGPGGSRFLTRLGLAPLVLLSLLGLRVLAILSLLEVALLLLVTLLDLLAGTFVLRATLLLLLPRTKLRLIGSMLRFELGTFGCLTHREIAELRIGLHDSLVGSLVGAGDWQCATLRG